MGTRDYRPFDLGNCSYYCRTASKADGLFIENAHGVVLKNVTFEYELPRKPWFGKCLVVRFYYAFPSRFCHVSTMRCPSIRQNGFK